ncbi:MAG: DNA-binding protein [Clostridiales bacterium]|nr:DNA-binding protein [Clostridiales bacterium]
MALTKIQLSELLQVYAQMLTEKQREALSMYCDCDCSLSEIAGEVGISRQGVRDAIVKGESTLVKLEEALHLAELYRKLSVAVEQQDKDSVFGVAKAFVSKE